MKLLETFRNFFIKKVSQKETFLIKKFLKKKL